MNAPAGARLIDPDDTQAAQRALDGPFEVFSQQVVVDPEGKGVATFDYELPERIPSGRRYELTWVRQAGTLQDGLHVDVAGASTQSDPGQRLFRIERRMTG